MKYMHLNSSCPYAGLANMLLIYGHDTEDFQIALDIDLASHIRYDEVCEMFKSGFSLQNKAWFDLYLKPRGFSYQEKKWEREKVVKYLQPGMMLGIFVEPGRKHAVVCTDRNVEKVTFVNNKWEQTEEPEAYMFSYAELLERIPEQVVVGYVEPAIAERIDYRPIYEESLRVWMLLREKLYDFIKELHSAEELYSQMNALFRPLLLDGLTMAQLRKDEVLTEKLTVLQGQFLNVLRQNKPARLSECMEMALLDDALDLICQHTRAGCQKHSCTETN